MYMTKSTSKTGKQPAPQQKHRRISVADCGRDLLGGVITALVSVPIAMGYAQIAGLPMQYGLYGSVLPIIVFGSLTTSRDFVFGVDAAPAALTGAAIASMGIAAESGQAMAAVPTLTFLVACWLIVFRLCRAGRMVKYISEPVMAGFISGICCTIILMQIPKLYGGVSGTGEAPELIRHIIGELAHFNLPSLLIGLAVIAAITAARRFIPKVPMSVVMMAAGACLTLICDAGQMGIRMLPEVERGFAGISLPWVSDNLDYLNDMLFSSLSIAAVIMAESLLASRSNAVKDGYRLSENRELLAYSAANLASSLVGCCPVNGSVSRTGIVRQFGVRSQLLSVSAAAVMLVILYFAAPLIAYLPVPVLTAIVISALMGACEFQTAIRLYKINRDEFYIFLAAFLGVLILGTVYGVVTGVVLSFFSVVVQAVTPPRSFLGIMKGKYGYHSLKRHKDAVPVKGVILYRFAGNLFFANIDTFENDIRGAVLPDTKAVIVYAAGISHIDTTAADRLEKLIEVLRSQGISFCFAENMGEIEDCLSRYGKTSLIESGCIKATMDEVLSEYGSCP